MASVEIDPTFTKCIRLMHSNTKESEDQLRKMLEDAIRQHSGSSKTISLLQKKEVKKDNPMKSSGSSAEGRKEHSRKEEVQVLDKVGAVFEKHSSKAPKASKTSLLIKPSQSMPSSNPGSPHGASLMDVEPMRERSLTPEEEEDEEDEDFALEILEEDLACVVCRGMDVGVRNQLVECLECHSLYHQECHQPPVPDDMNDPRSAWYCATCTRALNTFSSKSSSKSSPKQSSSGSTSNRDRESVPLPLKTSVVPELATKSSNAFKRTDSKGSSSSSSLTGNSDSETVSAASSSMRKTSSSTTSLPPKSFGGQTTAIKPTVNAQKMIVPKVNIISADKRLAIMKKKAAKLQEKRKLSK